MQNVVAPNLSFPLIAETGVLGIEEHVAVANVFAVEKIISCAVFAVNQIHSFPRQIHYGFSKFRLHTLYSGERSCVECCKSVSIFFFREWLVEPMELFLAKSKASKTI